MVYIFEKFPMLLSQLFLCPFILAPDGMFALSISFKNKTENIVRIICQV